MNDNLPNFVTLVTKGGKGQPLVSRYWGNGFLHRKHAGIRFRSEKDAILYLNRPEGVSANGRRLMLDRLKELHEIQLEKTGDPACRKPVLPNTKWATACRHPFPMLLIFSKEPESTYKLYGEDARTPGTFCRQLFTREKIS